MIARLTLALPFDIVLPENATFNVYEYEDRGYQIRVFPPVKTDVPSTGGSPESLTMNNQPVIIANGLRIDFLKESFDRTRDPQVCDPPKEFMSFTVQTSLNWMRYVTRAHQIHIADCTFERAHWRLEYLNDDGSQLEE